LIALVELSIVLLLAAGVGRAILQALNTVPEDRTERLAVAAAIGLGLIAYLILAVGLLGWLRVAPVVAVLALAGLFGFRGFGLLLKDLRPTRVRAMAGDISVGEAPPDRLEGDGVWLRRGCLLLLTAFGLITLLNCFVPPGAHEWDALAYHLAAPKVYLLHHRIVFLPTDHHSNFPFLVEMLFTLGLMLNGYALANLFHWAFWVLTLSALVALGRRHFAPSAGWIASVAFACAPIVLWEAGAAYIEHGMALFILLSIGSALEYRNSGESRWLTLAGILMGFALGTKALALVPAFALLLILIGSRARWEQLRGFVVAAIVVGCPFYVKSWAWTGDPVYPFGYSLFHGRYWSDELAQAYSGEQKSFGLRSSMLSADDDLRGTLPSSEPPGLFQRMRNAVIAPFALITVPRIFYNYNDPGEFNHIGYLFLALPPLLVISGPSARSSKAASLVAGVLLLWYLVWSQTMEYVRYVIPLLPLLGLLGGSGVVRSERRWRAIGLLAGVVVIWQSWLGISYFGRQAASTVSVATDPQVRQTYLERQVNHYASIEWLNKNTPPDTGVILFEENRGFYLDRPYLWGNYFHSLFIPYDHMQNSQEMVDWFVGHGFRFALVNLRFSQMANSSAENHARMQDAVRSNSEAGLMLEWYGSNAAGGERWRTFLGEAIRSGNAVVVNQASNRGVVVLEFRASRPDIHGNAMETQAGRGAR
jgi:hypothetical protein